MEDGVPTHEGSTCYTRFLEITCFRISYSSPIMGFPCGPPGKASACNVGDLGWIPGSGRSPGAGNGNPLQYSCLVNSMNRGAWWATLHEAAESDMIEQITLSLFKHFNKSVQL